jgi:hypothetical protein
MRCEVLQVNISRIGIAGYESNVSNLIGICKNVF